MTKDQVIQELKDLSKRLSKSRLTLADIRKVSRLEFYLYTHFENLADALNESGLSSSRLAKSYATTDDELLQYLWKLSTRIKKKPSSLDINRDHVFEYHIFTRHFTDLKNAYELAKKKFGSTQLLIKTGDKTFVGEKLESKAIISIKDFEYKGEFYGVAAENLVVSELLYRGYEAYLINVDLGLDVMAQKNGKTFYFQVKNISFDNSNSRSIPVTYSSYIRNKSNNVYYFLVMQTGFRRDFIIISQLKFQEFEEKGLIELSEGVNLNLTFIKRDNLYFIKFKETEESLEAFANEKAWRYLI